MPVQTRSQTRNKSQNAIIEVVFNSNTRQVKFITPEKTPCNQSCPPTPRAPRANKRVYPSFGNVVRQLDFNMPKIMEKYPLLYKNFIIANKFQKQKVDNFHTMIDGFANDRLFQNVDSNKKTIKLYGEQMTNISNAQLLDLAKTLISNTDFLEIFNQNEYDENTLNPCVYHWANMLSSIVLILMTRVVKNANAINPSESRLIIANEIIPYLIIFKEVFTNNKFPRFSTSRRFLGVMIQKMLSFGHSGFVLSALVIAHYYPLMVTKECYPYVDMSLSKLYIDCLDYVRNTNEPNITRLFKEIQTIYKFE